MTMNTKVILAITLALAFTWPNLARSGDLVIITANDNVEELQLEDIARIYLGKVSRFPSGAEVVPLDLDPSDPSYVRFARLVLKKTPAQLKAYWAKRIFTGKGKPPRTLQNREELRALVASHRRYLSYIDSEDADNSVRWVIELQTRPGN